VTAIKHPQQISHQMYKRPRTGWCPELDWVLLELQDTRFMVPNVLMVPNIIGTGTREVLSFMPQVSQGLTRGRAIVPAGVSGVFKTYLLPFVVSLALPWSDEVQEAWAIDFKCSTSIEASDSAPGWLTLVV
jgi:hypothetical protein